MITPIEFEFYWITIRNYLTIGQYLGNNSFSIVGYEYPFELADVKIKAHIPRYTEG